MKTYLANTFGWKYNQLKTQAVIKKRSQVDFWISIIIAFFIIIIVSQLLGQLDKAIRFPLMGKDFSLANPFYINQASAASPEAIKMVQSQRDLELLKNEVIDFTVGYKNLGKLTWTNSGKNKIDFRRKDAKSLTYKTTLTSSTNQPGQIGYFNLKLQAPSKTGTYKYKYVLTRNGKEVIKGSDLELVIKVVNKKSSSSTQIAKAQAIQPVTPIPTPTNSLNKPVGLAEICLSIKTSDFKAALVDQRLLDECLKIGIRVTAEGTSYVKVELPPPTVTSNPVSSSNPPNSQNTNNSNPPTNNNVPNTNPLPATQSGSNGPLVRIGLYNTTDPVVITANSTFKVKDQNKAILATMPAGVTAQIIFNFQTRTYNLVANGVNLSTSSYLRFESDSSTPVFEVVSLNWRPTWNTSINYNKYLGALEVRYSPNTGRLWVINELELENYLKGLAESSNGAPIEYQKALLTAARTYAMYHYNRGTKHADEYFTLDATYDQVYRGYNAQITLTQVSEAVEATKGQVVTYGGQVVVTPYFSYDDGRTRSFQEVWGVAEPWLISVKEPADYDKTTMYGHGVGMCARGAVLLAANHNYTFDQILKYYYTGIELKKIY